MPRKKQRKTLNQEKKKKAEKVKAQQKAAKEEFEMEFEQKLRTEVEETGGLRCIGADGKRNKKTKQREIQTMVWKL